MRIAFDLDGTLIRLKTAFPLEKHRFPLLTLLFPCEKLRKGSTALIRELQQEGHEVWVYTSSFRSLRYIRWLFWQHGLRLQGIVNQQKHNDRVKRAKSRFAALHVFPSKYPPLFGIELLVEDSEGVKMEGDQWGFDVAWIKGDEDLRKSLVRQFPNIFGDQG